MKLIISIISVCKNKLLKFSKKITSSAQGTELVLQLISKEEREELFIIYLGTVVGVLRSHHEFLHLRCLPPVPATPLH